VKKYFALVIFMLIIISIVSVVSLLPRGVSVGVGPMIVSAGGGGQGYVTIVFEGGELTLNGKKVTGELIVSFGGETHVVSVEELGRVGRVTFVFSEGLRREGEKMKSLYSYFGIEVSEGMSGGETHVVSVEELGRVGRVTFVFSEGLRREGEKMKSLYSYFGIEVSEGMSGEEIIRLLKERGLGGVRLPTLTLTLWLIDEEGNEYVLNEAFTSAHYYMSRGHKYNEAFKKAFQDPLAIAREGPTIIIPSIEKLREFFVRVDSSTVIGRLIEELGIWGQKPTITSDSQDIIYVENYLQFPQSPPEFFRDRVSVLTPGVDEVWLENEAWQNFIRLYASAYLFRKTVFTTPEEVRDYLSSPSWGWCSKEKYFVNFESILSTCLNPSTTYSVQWNHTRIPGTFFWFYKPYVITVTSNHQNLPPLELNLVYGVAEAGYTKQGFTFLGTLISGSLSYYITQDTNSIGFLSSDWQQGIRHVALIVPTSMQYNYDALFFKWIIGDYDQEYWIATPVPILTPYYEEVAWVSSEWWSLDYYDVLGNRVWGTYDYVSNIYALLYNATGALQSSEEVVRDVMHYQIPPNRVIIDNSRSNVTYYSESLASVMFGVFMDLVSTLFGTLTGNPVAKLFSFLSNFVGYADTTFYGSAKQLLLQWRRTGAPQETPVRVVKITSANVNASYNQLGRVPLVAQYVITIGQVGSPPSCPPNDPDCLIPENRTS